MAKSVVALAVIGVFIGTLGCGETKRSAPQRVQARLAGASALAASPDPIDFGEIAWYASKTVTFTNTGGTDLTISSLSMCATSSPEFSITSIAPVTIAPGASVTQDVSYVPVDFTGTPDLGCLTVVSDDPTAPTATVGIVGVGMQWAGLVYCSQCHGDVNRWTPESPTYNAPAPPQWSNGATATSDRHVGAHLQHLSAGPYARAMECSDCHAYPPVFPHPNGVVDFAWSPLATGGGVLAPTYPPTIPNDPPSPSDALLSCSSVYCHGATLAGGTNKTPLWTTVDGSQAACGTCHGVPPPAPGHVQTLECGNCHVGYTSTSVNFSTHINGTLETGCSGCHGDSSRTPVEISRAPPVDTQGNTATTFPGVGAHLSHLTGTSLRETAVACTECHVVPLSTEHATQPLDLTWGPLATLDATVIATFDTSALTCSNYCHGATKSGGTNKAPKWTQVDGTQARCGTCHGVPPPAPHATSTACGGCHPGYTSTTVNPATHINKILDYDVSQSCGTCHAIPPAAPHTTSTACGDCHPGYTSTTVNTATHANGYVEYDISNAPCNSCHGVPPPPPHSTSTTCGDCHTGYTSTTANTATHLNGVVDAAGSCTSCHGTASRTPVAIAPAPPVDTQKNTLTSARGVGAHQAHLAGGTLRAGLPCSSCHTVPTSSSHKNGVVETTWSLLARARGATASFNGTSCSNYCHGATLGTGSNHAPVWTTVNGTQDACGTCHGDTSGRPSTGQHTSVSNHSSRACTDCHAGTASATSTTHVNGLVDMNASINWNATSRSCAPTCHGTKSWGGTAYTIPATLYAAPETVTFGEPVVGTSVSQTVAIQNLGTASLTVNGLALCAGTSSVFSLSSTAGFTLAAGASQAITVTYHPTAAATDTGCFTIASSDTAHNPTTINLTGKGVPLVPTIAATPRPLAFGTVYTGSTTTKTLTVSNAGNGPLSVTSIGLCAGTTAGFTVSPATLTVAAGATGTVNVTFAPTAVGDVAAGACVAFTSNAGPVAYEVPLTGTAAAPPPAAISATPSPLDFGSVYTASTTTKTLTVSNTGYSILTVSAIGLCSGTTAGFSVSPTTLSLAAGTSGTVNVTFQPTVAGTVAPGSCVSFTSNDDARNPYNVPLTGTVTTAPSGPIITATPNPMEFGYVNQSSSSKSLTLTVKNTGSSSLSVTKVERCSGTSYEFSFSTSTFSLSSGSSKSITVTYDPSDSGDDTGCIKFTSNDTAHNPYLVNVSGTSLQPPTLATSTSSLSFGDVVATTTASKTVTVTNNGDKSLVVTSVGLCSGTSAEFSVPTSAFTLAKSASKSLTVSYTPTATGSDSGCIAIASNDPAHPVTNVSVSGAGIQPVISVNPTSLDFGYQSEWSGAKSLGLSVTNTGTGTLQVFGVARCYGTSDEFDVSSSGFSLAAGASTSLTVTYDPTDSGADTGCIFLSTNDPNHDPLYVVVTGTSVIPQQPIISVSPGTLDFGNVSVGNVATRTTVVSNAGPLQLVVSSIAIASGTSSEYYVVPANLTLAPGQSQTVAVTYVPSNAGTDTGSIVITSNDPVNPVVTLALSATGIQPTISASPTPLTFGSVHSGSSKSLTLTVSNTGNTSLSVSGISRCSGTSSEFSVSSSSFSVSPGSSQSVSVTYRPSGTGTDTGCISISSNDGAHNPLNIPVSGTGT